MEGDAQHAHRGSGRGLSECVGLRGREREGQMRRVPDSTAVPLAARGAFHSELRCTHTEVSYAVIITILSAVSSNCLRL